MIAVLAMRAALGISGFETIQQVTFFVVGLAPLAHGSGCFMRAWLVQR